MATKQLYTKAQEILIGAWTGDTAPTSGDALDYVIADSLSITQDDPEENTIDCETSDSPILTNYTAGSYTVDLNNASIDADFLTKVLGWEKITTPNEGYIAPETFATRYISLQVKFTYGTKTTYVYIPRIAIAPKLVFESLKTNVAYGTLSGTAESYEISDGKRTAIGIFDTAVMTKAAGA